MVHLSRGAALCCCCDWSCTRANRLLTGTSGMSCPSHYLWLTCPDLPLVASCLRGIDMRVSGARRCSTRAHHQQPVLGGGCTALGPRPTACPVPACWHILPTCAGRKSLHAMGQACWCASHQHAREKCMRVWVERYVHPALVPSCHQRCSSAILSIQYEWNTGQIQDVRDLRLLLTSLRHSASSCRPT